MTLDEFKHNAEKSLVRLKDELGSLRTGRAHASIVDGVMVEAYGAAMELKGLASITVPDARTLVIEPWDKSVLKDIEKAVQMAHIGVNPINDGSAIRLPMPPLTEETRMNLIKIMNQKLEQARISLRRLRDDMKEKIIGEEKEKKISEDEKFRLQQKLDEMVKNFNDDIHRIGGEKEKDIMTI